MNTKGRKKNLPAFAISGAAFNLDLFPCWTHNPPAPPNLNAQKKRVAYEQDDFEDNPLCYRADADCGCLVTYGVDDEGRHPEDQE